MSFLVTHRSCNALVFLSVYLGERYLHPFPLGTRDKQISAESKQRGDAGIRKISSSVSEPSDSMSPYGKCHYTPQSYRNFSGTRCSCGSTPLCCYIADSSLAFVEPFPQLRMNR